LITGGAGYIGSHIVEALVRRNVEVLVLDNLSTGLAQRLPEGVKIFVEDIRNTSLVTDILKANKVNTIIHLAASKSARESIQRPLKYYDNNLSGTISLLNALRESPVETLVLASSCSVLGDGNNQEGFSQNPNNPYGKSKQFTEIICEDVAKEFGIKLGILRYFNVVGCSNFTWACDVAKDSVIPNFIRKIKTQEMLRIFESSGQDYKNMQVRDYVDVRDVAEAHLKVLDFLKTSEENLVCNVSSGKPLNLVQLISLLKIIVSQNIEAEYVGRVEGDSNQIWCGVDQVLTELGWSPKFSIKESIEAQYQSMNHYWQ
jgi:UDP-glucose 4-epimerase